MKSRLDIYFQENREYVMFEQTDINCLLLCGINIYFILYDNFLYVLIILFMIA